METIEGFYVAPNGKKKRGKITVNKGIISRIGKATGKADVVFSDDCLIFPGFIDAHVHAREDRTKKWNYKEDFRSAGLAAINGGVTAFMEMPNTPEPTVTKQQVLSRRVLAKKSGVPVVLCAGMTSKSTPIPGVLNYKAFMTKSIGDLFVASAKDFERQVHAYKKFQLHIHCENHEIIERDQKRPAIAEIASVKQVLLVAKKERARIHICHLSTKESVMEIEKSKRQGVRISSEVTPHHLFFDDNNRNKFLRSNFLKMNPPLRTSADRKALLLAFKDGRIDILATDHAPHTIDEKNETNPSGVPELDTFGPFVCWLIKEQKVSLKRIADSCSKLPANLLSLNQGEIKKGMDASFTVLNFNKKTSVAKGMLKTKCAWSPFEGVVFPGSVETTIVKGSIFLVGNKHKISRFVPAKLGKRSFAHKN